MTRPPLDLFDGPSYEPEHDHARLSRQMDRIRTFMLAQPTDRWLTVPEIAAATADPENSVQAQLRHLRKAKHGSYAVQKRRRGNRSDGLYEWHVSTPLVGEARAS